ncbi:MAG: ABC transporter ATP-binding protein [Beijerinckiaceae bacterium]|nr:ABC transporter ATP-binding protein [Beijerinckiaceae bacterium]
MSPLIVTNDVSKRYQMGAFDVNALDGVSISIDHGESVAIVGPSGSGKSTLMNVLGCLDLPSGGAYLLDGHDVGRLSRHKLATFRSQMIGFIFQNFSLLPRATAFENVELPLIYAGWRGRERRARAAEMLATVGLADRGHHLPSQLSGGQQQRVAVARALAARPKLLLADEPTGSLDSKSSQSILALLNDINSRGITVVLITHDPGVASEMSRVISLHDGRVASDEVKARPAEQCAPEPVLP